MVTTEKINEWAEFVRDGARQIFNQVGSRAQAITLLYATVNPRTGEAFANPETIPIVPGDLGFDKDAYTEDVARFAKHSHAVGLVVIMQAWLAMVTSDGRGADEMLADIMKAGGPKQMPNRQEVLVVLYERVGTTETTQWHAVITRSEDKVELGEWTESRTNEHGGRFSNLLGNDQVH